MDKLERVARAIAQNGFGRDWDDFLPVNANDTDQGDLMEYAQAAIAALEPVTVTEAARVLLADGYAIEALSHWLQMMPSQVKSVLGDLAESGE